MVSSLPKLDAPTRLMYNLKSITSGIIMELNNKLIFAIPRSSASSESRTPEQIEATKVAMRKALEEVTKKLEILQKQRVVTHEMLNKPMDF
jgi:hypothetical protein